MTLRKRRIDSIPSVGGNAVIDFVNTCDWHATAQPVDLLKDFDALVRWSLRASIIGRKSAAACRRLSVRRPEMAAGALNRARNLREALFRILAALVAQRRADAKSLHLVNVEFRSARLRLVIADKCQIFRLIGTAEDLDQMTSKLALRAAVLLASNDIASLKMCARAGCGWFFIDRSRRANRRWCSMTDCGNAVKQSAFRRRNRG